METIHLVPIGPIETEVLKKLTIDLSLAFSTQVVAEPRVTVPRGAYDANRHQYYGPAFLKVLSGIQRGTGGIVLGVTNRDLFVPQLNFIFGEADLKSKVAVISLARLRPSFYHQKANRALFFERASKEAIHEIGHVLGMKHCPDTACIMHFSNTLEDTDRKRAAFCVECKKKLR